MSEFIVFVMRAAKCEYIIIEVHFKYLKGVFYMITLIAMWMMFKKAGEAGWAAIIPFYNMFILFKIVTGKGIKFLWLFVPVAGMIILAGSLSKAFGKDTGFAVGLFFLSPIFIWILGFGKAAYIKPKIDEQIPQKVDDEDEATV